MQKARNRVINIQNVIFLLICITTIYGNPYCYLNCNDNKDEVDQEAEDKNFFCRVFNSLWYQSFDYKYTEIKLTDSERWNVISYLNNIRSVWAKTRHVANMNMVKWDRELEFLAWAYISLETKHKASDYNWFIAGPETGMAYITGHPCMRSHKYHCDMIGSFKHYYPDSDWHWHFHHAKTWWGMEYMKHKEHPSILINQLLYNITERSYFFDKHFYSRNTSVFEPLYMKDWGLAAYWATLERIGCYVAPIRSEETSQLFLRIDTVCLFGAPDSSPRKADTEFMIPGKPCSQCPNGQTCNKFRNSTMNGVDYPWRYNCGESDYDDVVDATYGWDNYWYGNFSLDIKIMDDERMINIEEITTTLDDLMNSGRSLTVNTGVLIIEVIKASLFLCFLL